MTHTSLTPLSSPHSFLALQQLFGLQGSQQQPRFTQGPAAGGSSSASIRVAELPRQGQQTYERIRTGGPFPYGKDGMVFGNRERLLPAHKRGYYREYTVQTPGSRDRGARRIVCGGPPKLPHACYYTADHYASFRKIVERPEE